MQPPTVDELRHVDVLADLPTSALEWLAQRCDVRDMQDGEVFVRAKEPAEHMHFILSGLVEYEREEGGVVRGHWVVNAGEVGGMLPRSRMTEFPSTARAVGHTRVALYPKAGFDELAEQVPDLDGRLLSVMALRIRQSALAEEQRERMSALGKLAAGLAHELNNPAAAVRRAASDLRGRLDDFPALLIDWLSAQPSPDHVRAIEAVSQAAAKRAEERVTTLKRSELEDELADWLDDEDVPGGADRAGTLVEAGVRVADLDALRDVCGEHLAGAVSYLEFRLASSALLRDVELASGRISDLVASVKTYSHMDRGADRVETDVRKGLDSTVTMLAFKLRTKHITVERDYDEDLPSVLGDVGALNQVWTNLIVNAVDALHEGGGITLKACRRGEDVAVSIIDDGPGIPEDVQKRVFEPFFTTKGVGEGTGLGLDLVNRVVTRQHGGTVRVFSRPGRTEFLVTLPTTTVRA
ncbi:sensor histidine kinase [Deinococcus yavapaiensis]|uniref:histidine kinase n=1 Tax=Deinococcus yavapaiensis KR-236 TaxID=694435 RepID=A0A318SAB4_9DEIO|nr:ATP-binding protein [Deinococcus yavapaiensis]PYE55010.1 histidine kinase/DNA gyrase B/HSP90-like ATPase [Deinococcus yavapaiensis KR-236]